MRYLTVTACTLLSCWGLYACGQSVAPAVNNQGGGTSATSTNSSGGSTAHTSGGTSASSSTASSTEALGTGGVGAQGGSSSSGGNSARTGGTSAKASSSSSTGGSSAKGGTSATTSSSSGSAAAGGSSASSAVTGGSAKGGSSGVGGVTSIGGVTSAGGVTGKGGTSAAGGTVATGGSKATGGTTGGGMTLNKITNGQNGTTTRYWDCCMPSCSWKANAGGKNPVKVCGKDGTSVVSESSRNACENGGGFMCYWGAPWSVSDSVSFGYVAYNGVACGTCYQLDFTGGAANGKSMIVQVINIGGLAAGQFDILIPGGGVGAMNACNANGNMWNGLNLGDQYGGLLKSCGNDCNCAKQKCQSTFGSNAAMLAGCTWFTDWFKCADNPSVVYKQTSCPSDITNKSGITG